MCIHGKFGFLRNLTELSNDAIRGAAPKLMEEYSSDFVDCFSSELHVVQFSELFKKCIAQPQAQGQEKEVAQCEYQNTFTELKILLNPFRISTSHFACISMMTSKCS